MAAVTDPPGGNGGDEQADEAEHEKQALDGVDPGPLSINLFCAVRDVSIYARKLRVHPADFLEFMQRAAVLMLLIIFKGAGKQTRQRTGDDPDPRAVHEFIEDGHRDGKVQPRGKATVVFEAPKRRQADHFPFFITYGTAAAAMVDIGIHLDKGPAADGLFDGADNTGSQCRFDRRF